MPRLPRFCPANHPTHVAQQGNNRQVCFTCDGDMAAYAHSLHKGATKYGLAVHTWVFMANHVDLMMTSSTNQNVSQLMRHIGRHYVQPFNFNLLTSSRPGQARCSRADSGPRSDKTMPTCSTASDTFNSIQCAPAWQLTLETIAGQVTVVMHSVLPQECDHSAP